MCVLFAMLSVVIGVGNLFACLGQYYLTVSVFRQAPVFDLVYMASYWSFGISDGATFF